MGAKRKSYTPKYRQEAAHLVIDTGRTIAQVARDIGVGEQLLGRWVAIERSRMADPPEALDVDERAEFGAAAPRGRRAADGSGVPEKGSGLLRHGDLEPERAFAVIDAQRATLSAEGATCGGGPTVDRMADLLGVSRSGYYAWAARQGTAPGPRAARRADLVVKIKVAHDASDGVNGAPRVTADRARPGRSSRSRRSRS